MKGEKHSQKARQRVNVRRLSNADWGFSRVLSRNVRQPAVPAAIKGHASARLYAQHLSVFSALASLLSLRTSALILLTLALAAILPRLPFTFLHRPFFRTMSSTTTDLAALPRTQSEWRAALAALPSTPENIPAFYFAHGSPMLASPENSAGRNGRGAMMEHMGPHGPLANFLRDFGPVLLEKYKPKGIVVFSAHWDTTGERLGAIWSSA